MSDTDLVDSTSAHDPLALTIRSTSGSCTKTTSPRLSCAKSVMPIVAVVPSPRTHSCSRLYRRSSGVFTLRIVEARCASHRLCSDGALLRQIRCKRGGVSGRELGDLPGVDREQAPSDD